MRVSQPRQCFSIPLWNVMRGFHKKIPEPAGPEGEAWVGQFGRNGCIFRWHGALDALKEGNMSNHIILGIAFATVFLLLGCVAFFYLLRGKN